MVEAIIIKELHSNGEVFRIGDKVRLHMNPDFVRGLTPANHKYIGTITSIYEDTFWMDYHNGEVNYFDRDMKPEDRPYNESGPFLLKDVEAIERIPSPLASKGKR